MPNKDVRMLRDRNLHNRILSLLEKKYSETVHECLNCAGLLDSVDMDGDGAITELEVDARLSQFVR